MTDDDRIHETSDRARSQTDAEHTEASSQSMEVLGRLAAGISHDFKNLLTAILGNCHLMLEDAIVEERVGDVLRETLEAAGAGAEIVSQLMRFGGPAGGTDERADLTEVVDRALHLVGRFVGEDIRIESASAGVPLPVRLSMGQIEQIVMNLVLNAREAMPSGGSLKIAVGELRISGIGAIGSRTRSDVLGRRIPPGDYAVLTVTDDGAGMSPDVQGRVLEPYFTTKATNEGPRGLGLSTVYGLATGAGGWVALRSEQSAGTTVTVYLPLIGRHHPA